MQATVAVMGIKRSYPGILTSKLTIFDGTPAKSNYR
jgi:hypothetical protein